MANRKLIVEIAGDSRSLERSFKRAGNAAESFGRKMRHISGTAIGGRRGVRGLGRAAGVGGGLAGLSLLGLGALGISQGIQGGREATNFESSLAKIQGLAGQTAAQTRKWGNALLALGPAIGKKPQELADALYFIASSGVAASKAMSVLTVSAKASAAGLGETEVVADAVTSVMNAYADSGMTAARATDVLVATVREGKGEADQFAGTIGNIAAFASKLHVPFEEVGAALAAMTQLGTDPRTAAVQLGAFFSQILKTTPKMLKAAAAAGMPSLFEDLQKLVMSGDLPGAVQKLKSLNPVDLANIFPNIRAVRAVLGLQGARVVGIFQRMRNTAGSTGRAFAASARTSQHAWDRFHASIQTLRISFSQGLLPVVTRVVNALADKLADPATIARIRSIGKGLADSFQRFGIWFKQNWPAIQSGILATANGIVKILNAANWLHKANRKGNVPGLWKLGHEFGAGFSKLGQLRPGAAGGGGDVHVHGPVVIHHPVPDAKTLADHLHRHGKRHPHQTRGRRVYAGGRT